MEAAATAAIAPLIREYEHQQRCKEVVAGVRQCLPSGVTRKERKEAEEIVTEALSQLPVGASERQMNKDARGRPTADLHGHHGA